MFLFFVISQQISVQAEKDACLNIISFVYAQKTTYYTANQLLPRYKLS